MAPRYPKKLGRPFSKKLKLSGKQWAALGRAASSVIIGHGGRQYRDGSATTVMCRLPGDCKFPVGFPRAMVYECDGYIATFKFNAVKLLDWMYKNGFSAYNTEMLRKQCLILNALERSADKLINASQGELNGSKI